MNYLYVKMTLINTVTFYVRISLLVHYRASMGGNRAVPRRVCQRYYFSLPKRRQ